MSMKHNKPETFDPAKIKVNDQIQTELAQKAYLPNFAVKFFKNKEGKLDAEDLAAILAKKEEKNKNLT